MSEREVEPQGVETGTRLYLERNMAEGELHPFADGEAAVYSARAPGRDGSNEDAAALIPFEGGGALVVSDGMGGAPSGERASSLAVQALQTSLREASRAGSPLRGAILDGFERANRDVLAIGGGAAATLAVVEIEGRSVRPYHAGDSLILILGQRGRVKLQTVSHSPVGYGVEAGLIDADEALHHEDLHIISNAIGAADMRIEIGSKRKLTPRDTVLLASDGLTDNLHPSEIIERVRSGSLRDGMQALAEKCLERMENPRAGEPSKPDDLTFVTYRCGDPARPLR